MGINCIEHTRESPGSGGEHPSRKHPHTDKSLFCEVCPCQGIPECSFCIENRVPIKVDASVTQTTDPKSAGAGVIKTKSETLWETLSIQEG